MNNTNETKSLKAGLIEKFKTSDAERIEAERKAAALTTRETEERFAAFFGQKPERTKGMRAFFDDVTVQRNCGYDGGWQVIQNCSVCGKEVVSSAFSKLEDIGRQIAKDAKHYGCSDKVVVPSTDDKLLEAIRDFISENCNCD